MENKERSIFLIVGIKRCCFNGIVVEYLVSENNIIIVYHVNLRLKT